LCHSHHHPPPFHTADYDDDVSSEEPHVSWFWDILANDFNQEEQRAFLRFVWARPTLPPPGTAFSQRMKIQSAAGDDANTLPDGYLPRAHTCFFSINLPRYSSKGVMAAKLRYAILNCSEMDADFRLTDGNVSGWEVGRLPVSQDYDQL